MSFDFFSHLLSPPLRAATADVAERMCWNLVARKTEGSDIKDGVGVAIWQKPVSNDCYSKRAKHATPPMCETEDSPDAAW